MHTGRPSRPTCTSRRAIMPPSSALGEFSARVSATAKEATTNVQAATKNLTSKDWLKRTIDVTAIVEPAWLTNNGTDVWVRMHTGDEQKLNNAMEEGTREVPVCGGRWEAAIGSAIDKGNVFAGAIFARYYDELPRQLARCEKICGSNPGLAA